MSGFPWGFEVIRREGAFYCLRERGPRGPNERTFWTADPGLVSAAEPPPAPPRARSDGAALAVASHLWSVRCNPHHYAGDAAELASFVRGLLTAGEVRGGVSARDAWAASLAGYGYVSSGEPDWSGHAFEDVVAVAMGAAARMGICCK